MSSQRPAIRAKVGRALCAAVVALLWIFPTGSAAIAGTAQRPGRIVSINACTDQLVYALADPVQIAALTDYAVDSDFSLHADEIAGSGITLIKGSAEEVLKLRPDIVLAGQFTRLATRQRLTAFGIRLETFPPAESIEEAKAQIRRVGALVGWPERGEAIVAEIDRSLEEARAAIRLRGLRLLQLRRKAYISGAGTLFDDVLGQLGLVNAGRETGLKGTRQSSLEAVLKLRPDAVVMFDSYELPADQGAAMLFHPAVEALYPPGKRIIIPGNQIVCGGPALPGLLRSIASAVGKLEKAAKE
jgi:iron complex transport system substrate-binding protein